MSIFRWMYLAIKMSSWCNAVGVVLLIARGWWGTSLPRVSIRKEIQRRRCWAFSEKAWLLRGNLWRITLRKRNTYGVETFTLIYYSCHDSMVYQWKRITINSLIQTKKLYINHRCRRFYVNIPMNVFGNKNVLVVQRRRLYANISMDISITMDVLIMQLGTSCSFDSPGLARDEPSPGKRS